MRPLSVLLLLASACQPAMFLPAPAPGGAPAGATRALHRSFELSYAVAVQDGAPQLTAESVERVQLQVGDANDQQFARWAPQGAVPSSVVLAAAARLTRADGSVALAQPPPGAILELPPLSAGDRVDVFVRLRHDLPQAMPPWVMALSVPIDDLQVQVQAPPGLALRLVRGEGLGQHAQVPGEGGLWRVREAQLAALPRGNTAMPPRHHGPWLLAVPVGYQSGSVTAQWADSWDRVAAYVSRLLAPTMQLDAATASELRGNTRGVAQRFVPAATSLLLPGLPHAFAALAKTSWRAQAAAVSPFPGPSGPSGPSASAAASSSPAADLAQATPLEIAAVAVAAQPAGQLAVALVTRPEGAVVLPEVPGLYAFETAVLAEPQNPGWLFDDPGCGPCRRGEVAFEVAGGQALVLEGAAQGTLVQVPAGAAGRNLRRTQFAWDLNVEGRLHGSVLAEFRGPSALQLRGALLAPGDAAGRREVTRQLLFQGAGSQAGVEAVAGLEADREDREENNEDKPGDSDSYVAQMELHSQAQSKRQGYELTPAAVAGDGFPWDVAADAPGDVLLPGPLVVEVSCTLETPGGLVGKRAPKPVVLESPFGKYEARFVQKQSMVVYTRRLDLTARVVPREQRPQLAAFAAQIRAAESTPLLLRTEE